MLSLAFDPGATIPKKLLPPRQIPRRDLAVSQAVHAGRCTPTPLLPSKLVETQFPHIGPPLSGDGWVAMNGCCEVGVHRSSSIACNGGLYLAQRFAIDWMQLDKDGKFISGDAADVHAYAGYGAQVLAVADGTVVGIEDGLEDQKPGTLPDPSTITIDTVDGNHIVLDLGGGVYAFYAHLQKGSLTR